MAIMSQTGRVFFSGSTVATTLYTYSGSGSKSATTGWVDAKVDDIIVQTRLATKPFAADFVYRIEGKFDALGRAASIYCNRMSAVENIDRLYVVTPKVKQIRVGIKAADTVASYLASACSFYAGICRTERV